MATQRGRQGPETKTAAWGRGGNLESGLSVQGKKDVPFVARPSAASKGPPASEFEEHLEHWYARARCNPSLRRPLRKLARSIHRVALARGEAAFKVEELATRHGKAVASVRVNLAWLIQRGWLRRVSRASPRRPAKYELVIPQVKP
jgi:hypothetical protein